MEEIYSYYKENIDAYTRRLGNLKKKIHLMGSIRLALVAGAILSLWIFRDESWQCLTGITFAYIIPFALLMWYHNKMYARKVYAETLIKLNEDELKGLDYDFSAFDGAADKISGEHSFCLDLDVFGDRSLFQSLNRTVTGFGRERLAGWLSNPLTDKKEIVKRQEAVKELATLSALRQHFYVTGIIRQDTQDTRDNDINFMDRLTQRKHKFVDSLPWKLLIWAVPVLWIVLGIAYSLDWISGSLLNIYFLITLVIAYGRAKEINALYATVNKMESIFNRYSKLMQCVEEDNFQSEELKEISGQLANEKELASHAIKRLSSYIGGLDQRFGLAGIIFNLFYLRDTRHAILLERWIQTYSDKLPLWFDALARFGAELVGWFRFQPSGIHLSGDCRHLFPDGRQGFGTSSFEPGSLRKERYRYPQKSLVPDYHRSEYGRKKYIPPDDRCQLLIGLRRRSGLRRLLDGLSRPHGYQLTYLGFLG